MMSDGHYRVLLVDDIVPEGVERLKSSGSIEVDDRGGIDVEELRPIIGDYDALIVRSRTELTRDLLGAATQLRVIGRAGIGVDNIDVDYATRRGIIVLNAPGGNVISATEHTLALMLAMVRHIPQADAALRRGTWERSRFRGIELHGKTLGLVGAGRIGREVARRARAFGMQVQAYDPYLSKERAARVGIQLVTLPDLLEESDIVSVHCPLTDETRGLIGAAELAMMKPGAYLVNAARGGIVDEEALAEALRSGSLSGAAFDVFEEEPASVDHPLLQMENVVAVPHLGAATHEAQRGVGIEICEAVRDALTAGDIHSAVNAPELALEEYSELASLMDLAQRLGRVLGGLMRGSYRTLEVRYVGGREQALRPIAASAAVGLLSHIVEPPLNLVNALHVASDRGLAVNQVARTTERASAERIELELETAEGRMEVAGSLVGGERPRITRLGEYHVDVAPRGTILILQNRDVPGVIGRVGTVLGRAGVNIGEYHQARLQAGGEALAAISVDGVVDRVVIEKLAGLGEVTGVWQIELPKSERAPRAALSVGEVALQTG